MKEFDDIRSILRSMELGCNTNQSYRVLERLLSEIQNQLWDFEETVDKKEFLVELLHKKLQDITAKYNSCLGIVAIARACISDKTIAKKVDLIEDVLCIHNMPRSELLKCLKDLNVPSAEVIAKRVRKEMLAPEANRETN